MSHSLNNCQVPEYQSLICGCANALAGEFRILFLCLGTADDTFEYQTVDGIVDVRFRFNGGEQRMQQTPPVDEAPAGLGFVHSGYEVGGTVGLPEFDVVGACFPYVPEA